MAINKTKFAFYGSTFASWYLILVHNVILRLDVICNRYSYDKELLSIGSVTAKFQIKKILTILSNTSSVLVAKKKKHVYPVFEIIIKFLASKIENLLLKTIQ